MGILDCWKSDQNGPGSEPSGRVEFLRLADAISVPPRVFLPSYESPRFAAYVSVIGVAIVRLGDGGVRKCTFHRLATMRAEFKRISSLTSRVSSLSPLLPAAGP